MIRMIHHGAGAFPSLPVSGYQPSPAQPAPRPVRSEGGRGGNHRAAARGAGALASVRRLFDATCSRYSAGHERSQRHGRFHAVSPARQQRIPSPADGEAGREAIPGTRQRSGTPNRRPPGGSHAETAGTPGTSHATTRSLTPAGFSFPRRADINATMPSCSRKRVDHLPNVPSVRVAPRTLGTVPLPSVVPNRNHNSGRLTHS